MSSYDNQYDFFCANIIASTVVLLCVWYEVRLVCRSRGTSLWLWLTGVEEVNRCLTPTHTVVWGTVSTLSDPNTLICCYLMKIRRVLWNGPCMTVCILCVLHIPPYEDMATHRGRGHLW